MTDWEARAIVVRERIAARLAEAEEGRLARRAGPRAAHNNVMAVSWLARLWPPASGPEARADRALARDATAPCSCPPCPEPA